MKILFYFGHPAQYLFFRPVIKLLRERGHSIILAAKKKDVLTILLEHDKEEFHNLLPQGRESTRKGIIYGLLQREIRMFRLVRKTDPDILVGSDPSLAHIGLICGKKVITTTEDDYSVIKTLAWLTFPFTSAILTPEVCDVGMWKRKKTGYQGYMKLSYLHPAVFTPDDLKVNILRPFVLIRLASLTAHHDFGITGLTSADVRTLIDQILRSGRRVAISTEQKINQEFEQYQLIISPSHMHHYLAAADLLISDSQSMSVEAAMLGTPSIRYSDFAGRISVLEELENKYELTFGIPTNHADRLFALADKFLTQPGLKDQFLRQRNKMLQDKIRVGRFVAWFIENYSESRNIMRIDPHFQFTVSKSEKKVPEPSEIPGRNQKFDFTLGIYRKLMNTLVNSKYHLIPFGDYLKNPEECCVILRQDVDEMSLNSLKAAQIQHALGIKSTYYFRVLPKSYDPRIVDKIVALGHEIGYHYEDMEFAYREKLKQGYSRQSILEEQLFDRAIELFEQHLMMLRKHYPVKTICMHGSPLSPFDNKSIWKKYNYRDFGIIGEPYFDLDFSKILYLTDTGRSWHGAKYSVRDKPGQQTHSQRRPLNSFPNFYSTMEIISAINADKFPEATMMTFHPQRWCNDPFHWTRELVLQNIKNSIKHKFYVDANEHF
jgi:predicted glycosyltransferase